MIMTLRYTIFILITLSSLKGQWLSFDLSKADKSTFEKQVEPTIISAALSGGQSTLIRLTQNKRLGVAVSMYMGFDIAFSSYQSNPLLHPFMLEGQFLVTDNLAIKGKMNLISNKGETVNIAGYGFNYLEDSWFTSIYLGWLKGPTHLRIRYVDSAFIVKRTVADIPVLLGLGYNNYRGSIIRFEKDDISRSIDNSITYLIAGTELRISALDFELQARINSKFFQLNFTIFRLFF